MFENKMSEDTILFSIKYSFLLCKRIFQVDKFLKFVVVLYNMKVIVQKA